MFFDDLPIYLLKKVILQFATLTNQRVYMVKTTTVDFSQEKNNQSMNLPPPWTSSPACPREPQVMQQVGKSSQSQAPNRPICRKPPKDRSAIHHYFRDVF